MKLQYREATAGTVGMECEDRSCFASVSSAAFISSFAQVTPEDYELHKSQIKISWQKNHSGRMQRKGGHPGWS